MARPQRVVNDPKGAYLETLQSLEHLHRRFLDVIKAELDRLGVADVNNVQALLLRYIGRSTMSVRELTARGYYQGSNVSYSVKKLTEAGYMEQERSPHDRRSIRVRLSPRGLALVRGVDAMIERQVAALGRGGVDSTRLAEVNAALAALERFWSESLVGRPRE